MLLASLMSHFTQIGLRMRAMAESPRMVQLAGINSERVGVAIWVLSSFLAGLAGVLLAPLFAELQALNFTDLLVAAIAAAALGSLTSLPLAFWGGIGLGVVQELLGGYLPSGSVLSSGLRPALPFAVLIVLLLVLPGLRERWFHDDPLAGCDPPPPPMATAIGGHGLEELLRGGGWMVLAVFFVSCLTWMPGNWTFTLTQGLAYSIIFLSIVLLTGMSGQISLCQAAFAGIGAFTCAQLVSHFGISVLVGIVAGGAVAAVVGVVVAMPALRLGGLALALATLAFGLLADNVGFQFPWSGNGDSGVNIPRPQLGSLNFTSGKAFFVLAFVLLIACSAVVLAIRQGTTGRELAAMRGSELAAASIGTNLAKLKITVFAVAAALAGVGGALYGSLQGTVSPNDFNSLLSLVFMVVVVTTGVYTVQGRHPGGDGLRDPLPGARLPAFGVAQPLPDPVRPGRCHLCAASRRRRRVAEAARGRGRRLMAQASRSGRLTWHWSRAPGSPSVTAASSRSTTSRSPSSVARPWASSAPTVPGRRRCSTV